MMKDWKYLFRVIGVLVSGIMLLKMTYQFKHSSFMFDLIFFYLILLSSLFILIWSFRIDWKQFQKSRKIIHLIPIGLGLVFAFLICMKNWQNNSTFDKPTLIRIYGDGDFNGTSIDFKLDGTYIFESASWGSTDYSYGIYEMLNNQILLDKNELDNIIKTNKLEIRPKTVEYIEGAKTENYVFQINQEGTIIKNESEFRVVIDNRK